MSSRNLKFKNFLILFYLFFCSNFCSYSTPLDYQDQNKSPLKSALLIQARYFFIDSTNKLPFSAILRSNSFHKISQPIANFGLNTSTIWLGFILQNKESSNDFYLNVDNPNLDEVAMFHKRGNGIDSLVIGLNKPFTKRTIHHQNFIFSIHIHQNRKDTLYLRVKSLKPIILPIYFSERESLFNYLLNQDLVFGLYMGLILVMFLYNLFLFVSVRDPSYFSFSIYILLVGLTQSGLLGYNFRFLWPNSPYLEIHSASIIPALVGFASIFFIKVFLESKKYSPSLNEIMDICLVSYLIVIVLNLFDFIYFSQLLVQVTAFIASVVGLLISYQLAILGVRKAKFYLIAWSLFLLGICLFVLRNFNLIPESLLMKYILVLGSGISITLLSLALADNINVLKKEKDESQAMALRELGKNEVLIRDQNLLLENKVMERTSQLRLTMEDLNKTMDELKETQSALVDSEKMVSLGQLTAGIAHEINNPINFVTSNINPLKRDIEDVYSLLDILDKTSENLDEDNRKMIVKAKKSLDIDFVKDEIDLLLRGIEEGAIRTSEIIRGLKNFARVDEQDLKEINLNEGIESTLLLLRNKTKGEITIDLDLQEIPPVHCYAGKMNQVFMNILSNSIYAVNKYYSKGEGIIFIQTRQSGANEIEIRFKDNGPGIPQIIQSKIFEPFFTTKPVGDGTGLGLSIVRTIVESHRGQIFLKSSPSTGTEFLITLPITH